MDISISNIIQRSDTGMIYIDTKWFWMLSGRLEFISRITKAENSNFNYPNMYQPRQVRAIEGIVYYG